MTTLIKYQDVIGSPQTGVGVYYGMIGTNEGGQRNELIDQLGRLKIMCMNMNMRHMRVQSSRNENRKEETAI